MDPVLPVVERLASVREQRHQLPFIGDSTLHAIVDAVDGRATADRHTKATGHPRLSFFAAGRFSARFAGADAL